MWTISVHLAFFLLIYDYDVYCYRCVENASKEGMEMKKIIAIFILLVTTSVSAGWLFNSFTDDQKEACQENIKLNSNKNIGACAYVGNAYLNGYNVDKRVGSAIGYFRWGCGADYLNGGVSDVDA